MADTTNEVDMDSVIDRLLEGENKNPPFSLRHPRISHFDPSFIPPYLSLLYTSCFDTVRTKRIPFASLCNYTVRGHRPGRSVVLQEHEIRYLCTKSREIFINQPILLELEAPIKVCGKRDAAILHPQSSPVD